MNDKSIWEEVRKKIKFGIRKNFTEIRKQIGYKNEETLANILGITRQTLSKFGEPEQDISNKNNNMLLISILTLMDQFIYNNQYDYDKIDGYIEKFNKYFFESILKDKKIQQQAWLILPQNSNYISENPRYVNAWLKTFEYELEEIQNKNNEVFNYTKLNIRKIIEKHNICYITSDFLLHNKADKFLKQLFYISGKKNIKIKISKFTIDAIQNNRLTTDLGVYKNVLNILEIIKLLNEDKRLIWIKSNPKINNEVHLIINEILESDISNAIVFSQESSYEILNAVNANNVNGTDIVLKMITKEFKALCLTLNDDDIDMNESRGYKICALPSEFEL